MNKDWTKKCTCENFQQNEDCEHIGNEILKKVGLMDIGIKSIIEEFRKKFWWKYKSIAPEDSNKFSASECKEIENFFITQITELLNELKYKPIGQVGNAYGMGYEKARFEINDEIDHLIK